MPYIPTAGRVALKEVNNITPLNAGELQYAIAVMIKNMMATKEFRYQDYNDIIGALAGAQMEFYRRHVAPYEDTKINQNGDV